MIITIIPYRMLISDRTYHDKDNGLYYSYVDIGYSGIRYVINKKSIKNTCTNKRYDQYTIEECQNMLDILVNLIEEGVST